MKRVWMGVAVAALCGAGTAQGDEIMLSYNTTLSRADAVNSSGAPLEGWCTIIQQDRANYHRFNRRDAYDEGDPFFTTGERRAMIAGKCVVPSNVFQDPGAQIRSGAREFDLTIFVYGQGGTVTRIEFADAF